MLIPKDLNNEIDKHITAQDIEEMEAMTEDEKLQWECDRMNRNLEPVYKRDWVCPKCHNSAVYFKIVEQEYTTLKGEKKKRKEIIAVICSCAERR